MPTSNKHLRRCRRCRAAGHNRARCPLPDAPVLPAGPSTPRAVAFAQVSSSAPRASSPHVVDLKIAHTTPWSGVTGNGPKASATPLYHYYHHLPPLNSRASRPMDLPTRGLPHVTFVSPVVPVAVIEQTKQWYKFLWKKWQALRAHLRPKQPNRLAGQAALTRPLFAPGLPTKAIASAPLKREPFKRWPLFWKLAAPAAAALILIVSPLSAKSYYRNVSANVSQVMAESVSGFKSLVQVTTALKNGELEAGRAANEKALHHFTLASAALGSKHRLLQGVVGTLPGVGADLASGQHLIRAGENISLGNTALLKIAGASTADKTLPLTARLNTALVAASQAAPAYRQALFHLKAVDAGIIPVDYQASFQGLVTIFEQALRDLEQLSALRGSLAEIFGLAGQRRYLVIFQNPHELRPTGGFMGSYAVVDVKDGRIKNLTIPPGGTYDVQGQLNAHVEPPRPLLITNKRWEFQDANWFPDFPTTAEKILWFYRRSRSVTADGVIAVNATVLERLLGIIGPVELPERRLTISAGNALATLQEVIETGSEKKLRRPKQILSDLAGELMQTLANLPPSSALPLAGEFNSALQEKEIQIYLADSDAETAIRSAGWGGNVIPTRAPQDYLMVVNTNLQGGKSDALIDQAISHQAVVAPDGSITNTVTITRAHRGASINGLYGQTNIDYLRLYVPEESTLVSARGFTWPPEQAFRSPEPWYAKDDLLQAVETEIGFDDMSGTKITSEFGKYAFGNWVVTEPGTVSEVRFTYRLPFAAFASAAGTGVTGWKQALALSPQTSRYQLVLQRQSGAKSAFSSEIIYPDNWRPTWSDGPSRRLAQNGLHIDDQPLTADTAWSVLMENAK